MCGVCDEKNFYSFVSFLYYPLLAGSCHEILFVDAFKFLLLKSPAKYDLPEKYLGYATFSSSNWKMLVFAIT